MINWVWSISVRVGRSLEGVINIYNLLFMLHGEYDKMINACATSFISRYYIAILLWKIQSICT